MKYLLYKIKISLLKALGDESRLYIMISVSIDLNCASKMKKMGKTRNIISQQPKSLNEIETVKSERVKKEKLKSHSKIDEREEGTTFDIQSVKRIYYLPKELSIIQYLINLDSLVSIR